MDGSKLLLYPMNDTDNLELYIRNTEWDLTDFAVKSYEKIYDCCPYAFPGLLQCVWYLDVPQIQISPTSWFSSGRHPTTYSASLFLRLSSLLSPLSDSSRHTLRRVKTQRRYVGGLQNFPLTSQLQVSLGVTACMSTSIIMMVRNSTGVISRF